MYQGLLTIWHRLMCMVQSTVPKPTSVTSKERAAFLYSGNRRIHGGHHCKERKKVLLTTVYSAVQVGFINL